jgi:hypothetical protein
MKGLTSNKPKMTNFALPKSKALKAGEAVAHTIGQLAYHPPSLPEARGGRMERPHGGKGPHN